jgi:hypothetical protein
VRGEGAGGVDALARIAGWLSENEATISAVVTLICPRSLYHSLC